MRITVTSSGREVNIKIKGKSVRKLAEAEAAARRLLDATPAPAPTVPIGFAVSPDTEHTEDG